MNTSFFAQNAMHLFQAPAIVFLTASPQGTFFSYIIIREFDYLQFVFICVRRRVLMVKQNYRCAGCGAKVEPKYIRKYRYCEYLGRYFCTSCHTNQTAILPSRVLNKWDFSK